MICHIPKDVMIWRTENITDYRPTVTTKPSYFVETDYIGTAPPGNIPEKCCQFQLPVAARPFVSIRVRMVDVRRIASVGDEGLSEEDLIRKIVDEEMDVFYKVPDQTEATAEEKIIGRPLTPEERNQLRTQWEDDENFQSEMTSNRYDRAFKSGATTAEELTRAIDDEIVREITAQLRIESKLLTMLYNPIPDHDPWYDFWMRGFKERHEQSGIKSRRTRS